MQPAKEKLHTLYKIYEKPMYHIAYAILHHTQQTEDAVSEAFCREIARQCGIKEAAARKRFERARKAMIKQKGVTSYEQLFSL